jgi:hypothetical protein
LFQFYLEESDSEPLSQGIYKHQCFVNLAAETKADRCTLWGKTIITMNMNTAAGRGWQQRETLSGEI